MSWIARAWMWPHGGRPRPAQGYPARSDAKAEAGPGRGDSLWTEARFSWGTLGTGGSDAVRGLPCLRTLGPPETGRIRVQPPGVSILPAILPGGGAGLQARRVSSNSPAAIDPRIDADHRNAIGIVMATNTIRLHRVLRATPEEGLSGFPGRRRDGEMASAERIHRQGPPDGRKGGRDVQDVVHEFHDRPKPLVRRQVPGARAERAHPLHGPLRRPEPEGRFR